MAISKLILPGRNNIKLAKNKYLTYGLSLAANKISGYQVCPKASKGCIQSCIFHSGLGYFPAVMKGRIARTRLYFENPKEFRRILINDLAHATFMANRLNKKLACRLNVFSDILWEKKFPEIFEIFKDCTFYDYTKLYTRLGNTPPNYHLTFSRSENNGVDVDKILKTRFNIACVFKIKQWPEDLPSRFMGRRVIDGELSDERWLEPSNSIIALKAKGKGSKNQTGFVIHI